MDFEINIDLLPLPERMANAYKQNLKRIPKKNRIITRSRPKKKTNSFSF